MLTVWIVETPPETITVWGANKEKTKKINNEYQKKLSEAIENKHNHNIIIRNSNILLDYTLNDLSNIIKEYLNIENPVSHIMDGEGVFAICPNCHHFIHLYYGYNTYQATGWGCFTDYAEPYAWFMCKECGARYVFDLPVNNESYEPKIPNSFHGKEYTGLTNEEWKQLNELVSRYNPTDMPIDVCNFKKHKTLEVRGAFLPMTIAYIGKIISLNHKNAKEHLQAIYDVLIRKKDNEEYKKIVEMYDKHLDLISIAQENDECDWYPTEKDIHYAYRFEQPVHNYEQYDHLDLGSGDPTYALVIWDPYEGKEIIQYCSGD